MEWAQVAGDAEFRVILTALFSSRPEYSSQFGFLKTNKYILIGALYEQTIILTWIVYNIFNNKEPPKMAFTE